MARSAPAPWIGRPSQTTCPLVWCSRPARMRSSVDLPQPEAPTSVTNSEAPISSSMSCSAAGLAVPPSNTLPRRWTWTLLMVSAPSVHVGEGAPVQPAEALVHHQPDQADQDDPAEDHV